MAIFPPPTGPMISGSRKASHLRTKVIPRSGMWDIIPGQTFHGAKGPVEKFVTGGGLPGSQQLFGAGVYTTNSPEVAKSYANSPYKPALNRIYRTEHSGPQKIMDLMKPQPDMNDLITEFFDEHHPHPSVSEYGRAPLDDIQYLRTSLRQAREDLPHSYPAEKMYDQAREATYTRTHGEFSDFITQGLKDKGYTTLTHTGGQRIGGLGEHGVSIFLNPEDLNITENVTDKVFKGLRVKNISESNLKTFQKHLSPYARDRQLRRRELLAPSGETKPWMAFKPLQHESHTRAVIKAGTREIEEGAQLGERQIARRVLRSGGRETVDMITGSLLAARRVIGRHYV